MGNEAPYTYFKNWGRMECHDELSCFKVKNNSKVDTVLGSHLICPSLRHTWSVSKLMNRVQPLQVTDKEHVSHLMDDNQSQSPAPLTALYCKVCFSVSLT